MQMEITQECRRKAEWQGHYVATVETCPPPCVSQYRVSLGVSSPTAWHFLGGAGRVTPPTAVGLVHHLFMGG